MTDSDRKAGQVVSLASVEDWQVVCDECAGHGRFKGLLFPIVITLISVATIWLSWKYRLFLTGRLTSRGLFSVFLVYLGPPYLVCWAWRRTQICDTCNGSGFRVKSLDEHFEKASDIRSRREACGVTGTGVRWVLKSPRRALPKLPLLYDRVEELSTQLVRIGWIEEGKKLRKGMTGTTSSEVIGNLWAVLNELRSAPKGLDNETMIVAMNVLHDVEVLLRPK